MMLSTRQCRSKGHIMISKFKRFSSLRLVCVAVCLVGATRLGWTQNAGPSVGEQALRQANDLTWRKALTMGGVGEDAAQAAIVRSLEERYRVTEPLRLQARQLADYVASKDASDLEISSAYANLRAALKEEQQRRSVANSQLNAEIAYDKKPVVATALTLYGVAGDEAAVVNSVPQALARLRVKSVAEGLAKLGVDDPIVRQTIIKFMMEQEKSLLPLVTQASALRAANRTANDGTISDQERQIALDNFRDAVARQKAKRDRALFNLDAKIGFTRSPRCSYSVFSQTNLR